MLGDEGAPRLRPCPAEAALAGGAAELRRLGGSWPGDRWIGGSGSGGAWRRQALAGRRARRRRRDARVVVARVGEDHGRGRTGPCGCELVVGEEDLDGHVDLRAASQRHSRCRMNNLEGRTVLCFSEAVLVECATRLSESKAESRRPADGGGWWRASTAGMPRPGSSECAVRRLQAGRAGESRRKWKPVASSPIAEDGSARLVLSTPHRLPELHAGPTIVPLQD